jgi:hypothetical protein
MVGSVFQVLCFVKDEEQWGYVQSVFEKVARTFRKQVWRSYILFEMSCFGLRSKPCAAYSNQQGTFAWDVVQALFIRARLGDSEAQQACDYFGFTGESPITVIYRASSVI